MSSVADKIRTLMKKRGLNCAELARAADLNYMTVSAWLKKTASPNLKCLEKICPVLNVSLAELVSDEPIVWVHDEQTNQLLALWQGLTDAQKGAILEIARASQRLNE